MLFIVFACFITAVNAQDKIYRKNGKVVEAKIIEVGASEVKYKNFTEADGPVYVLETDRIKKIVFSDGKTQTFTDNLKDIESYEGQLKKAIKINFFSPLYGYTEIGYEKNMGVGKSIEFSLGIIGLGKSETLYTGNYSNGLSSVKRGQSGAFVSVGYKFNKLPDFVFFGKTRMSHLMQGTYFKPVVYFGSYKENTIISKASLSQTTVGKQNVTFGALQLELGKQRVFADKFILDTYIGVGYGIDNKKDTYQYENSGNNSYYYYNDNSAYNYANSRAGNSPSLSVTFGIKLGMLIK